MFSTGEGGEGCGVSVYMAHTRYEDLRALRIRNRLVRPVLTLPENSFRKWLESASGETPEWPDV